MELSMNFCYNIIENVVTQFSMWEHWDTSSSTNLTQSALSQASPSCPQAWSALHLQLHFNPQSFFLFPTFTACAPYLLLPLY